MSEPRGFQFLLSPGPTPVPARILRAMHRQPVDLSSPEFIALCDSVFEDVKSIFRTKGIVHLFASNGHGGWEATLANTLSPGDAVLIPEVGVFSESWRSMAEAMGLVCHTVQNDWRSAIDPNKIEEALRADTDHKIKAVLFVHVETATGVASDVLAARKAIDAAGHPALFCVDTIASLCTVDFPMDEWGVDVTVAASQKGLMMPPGLALVATSDKAMEVCKTSTMPRRYWDWRERIRGAHYERFCGTAPEHHIFGLREALDMIAEETLQGVIGRHARLAAAVHAAVTCWAGAGDIAFNAVNPAERAKSVTTILTPDGIDAETIRDAGREMNLHIGSGIGPFHRKGFRIGHMGDINEPMILGSLAAVETVLRRMGIAVGPGALDAAIASLSTPPGAEVPKAAE
jgi:alanine-glyoxylate transaminase/serine-glyoxylate transaminase/serine-pyruvate transaminase